METKNCCILCFANRNWHCDSSTFHVFRAPFWDHLVVGKVAKNKKYSKKFFRHIAWLPFYLFLPFSFKGSISSFLLQKMKVDILDSYKKPSGLILGDSYYALMTEKLLCALIRQLARSPPSRHWTFGGCSISTSRFHMTMALVCFTAAIP